MEISLIRHGKSTCIENNRMTCQDFNKWVEIYDNNGVFKEISYPTITLKKIATSEIIFTSGLKRSFESAKQLNPNIELTSDPLFNETGLPTPTTKFRGLKLTPMIWAVILRCLWISGYSRKCESFRNAKQRSREAADLLMRFAEEHQSVALVGHGFFNMLIAKELQKVGWKSNRKPSAKHWNCITYTL